MIIAHDDTRLSWPGAVSLEQKNSFTRPWRLPFKQLAIFPVEILKPASWQAGVRLTFRSTSRRIWGEIEPLAGDQKLDLYINRVFFKTLDLTNKNNFHFDGLGEGEKSFELWLPHTGDFALRHLELEDGSTLLPDAHHRPKWVTYGSSITQCSDAASPSMTWPGIVARERALDLTCLGFSGQCHLDPQVAVIIRDLPADYISLCVGINIYDLASLNARTFPAALVGFVQLIREKHPDTPLLLISPIFSFDRETTPNKGGWTLSDYRHAVSRTAERLRKAGDANVLYLSGLDLLGSSAGRLMPDQLHPNAEGYELIGRNFLTRCAPSFFGQSKSQA